MLWGFDGIEVSERSWLPKAITEPQISVSIIIVDPASKPIDIVAIVWIVSSLADTPLTENPKNVHHVSGKS